VLQVEVLQLHLSRPGPMATSTTPQPYTAGRPENSTTSVDANEFAERVRKLVTQVEGLLPTLPSSVREHSQVALAELREAAAAATPDVSRLRRGLESLRHVLEHATGHVVATGALALIGELLSRAAH
jgi:hypothetical protein